MNKPMSPSRRAEIEARLKAATPGPWVYESNLQGSGIKDDNSYIFFSAIYHGYYSETLGVSDAHFIANAPADIADLLADNERLGKLLAKEREEVEVMVADDAYLNAEVKRLTEENERLEEKVGRRGGLVRPPGLKPKGGDDGN